MIVYPAIDIRGGRCVRLVQGDHGRETVFDVDPAAPARRWATAGAEWLHVVDLDGAISGRPVNQEAIRRIRETVELPIQLGGGLRRMTHLEGTFGLGVNRLVLGTAALRDPALVRAAVARWGGAIAVGLDARNGMLALAGWYEQTDVPVLTAAEDLLAAGVRTFIFTDIGRDGSLTGPNLPALAELVRALAGRAGVIASGGIARLEDVAAVARTGAAGVIIGRALYDGRVDLAEALNVARAATDDGTGAIEEAEWSVGPRL